MDHDVTRALVAAILRDPFGHPWKAQEPGLYGLWLDEGRVHRLHVWDPGRAAGEPPVHDHPFDLESVVVAGEVTNTRFVEAPGGEEYLRERYVPGVEDEAVSDTVRLRGTASVLGPGAVYRQEAPELHRSDQVPGTVTVIRCRFREVRELTVCRRPGEAPVRGASRPATRDEVGAVARLALAHL